MKLLPFEAAALRVAHGQPVALRIGFAVDGDIVFDPDVSLELFDATGTRVHASNLRMQVDASWLPRGRYVAHWLCGTCTLPAGSYRLRCGAHVLRSGTAQATGSLEATLEVGAGDDNGAQAAAALQASWQLAAAEGSPPLETLSWRKGHADWFFRHFDHAARTIISYMLGDSPLLRGRVLDVGCGDGITDLGIALRCEPELLVGVDPFRGFDRLPQILAENGLGTLATPKSLRYLDADANHLPFPDDSFDVVLSWGSLEHIAGGYLQALREIKRVLRDGGLFFVHPGLYYSNYGHHLGEFSSEPFFHLKQSQDSLREFVLAGTPDYMDRSGEFATPAQYWQWYTELNPITVSGFEQELRALAFEPWRVAIRTEDRIEYTPELLRYPMQDLATVELYLSCINRKQPRPAGYRQLDPAGAGFS